MNLKKLALAAAAGVTLFAAAPAFAQSHWNQGYGWRAPQRHHYHRPPVYVYAPPPVVYYAPPAPYYYAPPRPAIFGSVPIGDTRLRIGLRF